MMKHEREWYTCDRCGAEINDVPEHAKFLRMFRKPKIFNLDIETVELMGFVRSSQLISEKVLSATIDEYYSERHNKIHLCEKCRKDFERFMKNA